MDLSMTMSASDEARVAQQTLAFNRALGEAAGDQQLGRDDFLRILLTQLQNQDPTQPMEDKEFIAQMAQFSSLEQMTNIARGFENLSERLGATQAIGVLGRTVELIGTDGPITGRVQAVAPGAVPKITVNDIEYDFADVLRVIE